MKLAFVCVVASAIAAAGPVNAASRLFDASPAGTQTISFDGADGVAAVKAGWFDATGANDQGNPNYVVSSDFNRNFFVFDALADTTSAVLRIGNDPTTGLVLDPGVASVTWTLYDVTTVDADDLTSGTNSFGRTDVYADLGSGTVYGAVTVSGPTSVVEVALNPAGRAALALAATNGVRFVLGGALTENAAVTGVPEPQAWALMVAGFGLIGVSLRRRHRATPV